MASAQMASEVKSIPIVRMCISSAYRDTAYFLVKSPTPPLPDWKDPTSVTTYLKNTEIEFIAGFGDDYAKQETVSNLFNMYNLCNFFSKRAGDHASITNYMDMRTYSTSPAFSINSYPIDDTSLALHALAGKLYGHSYLSIVSSNLVKPASDLLRRIAKEHFHIDDTYKDDITPAIEKYNTDLETSVDLLEHVQGLVEYDTKADHVKHLKGHIHTLKQKIDEYDRYHSTPKTLGGRPHKNKSPTSQKWVSTGRHVSLKDGTTKRMLYKNASKPGDLRIRRMATRNGRTIATYVKPR